MVHYDDVTEMISLKNKQIFKRMYSVEPIFFDYLLIQNYWHNLTKKHQIVKKKILFEAILSDNPLRLCYYVTMSPKNKPLFTIHNVTLLFSRVGNSHLGLANRPFFVSEREKECFAHEKEWIGPTALLSRATGVNRAWSLFFKERQDAKILTLTSLIINYSKIKSFEKTNLT